MPPNSVPVSFGSWLQIRRRWLQLSQTQLGARVNYSAIAIRKLESGMRRCSDQLAGLLAGALEIPVQHHPAFMISARTGILESVLLTLVPGADSGVDQADQANPLDIPNLTEPARQTRLEWAHLAQPPTDIFGRATEIEQLLARLRDPSTQLITLVGAPGVGKTRLALEVLNRADEADWPDGKFFVPLAHIDHVALIPEAIAAAMGIRETNARQWRDTVASQNVFQFVKGKRVLLVLDNFEHLSEGVLFVSALLAAAPMVKVLVTSRGNLNLMAEQAYQVHPLTVPTRAADLADAAGNGAVQLLVARAQSRQPTFQLTSGNLKSIIALCQLLDGLPLALELAAVRLRALSPQVLLAQLNEPASLSDSISTGAAGVDGAASAPVNSPTHRGNSKKWLNKPTNDMPVRHRSLAEALTWSYNLLTPTAQRMFDQLGVFQGGFTREAALAVTQGALEDLDDLAGQSLIQIQDQSNPPSGGIRLSLLETFRAFVLGKLEASGESYAVNQRHAQYFLTLARHAEDDPPALHEQDWLERLSVEVANIRSALSWCLANDLPTGFIMARYMVHYWLFNGNYPEGRDWVTRLLQTGEQAGTVPPESRAYLICVGTMLHVDTPIEVVEEQLELFRRLNDRDGIVVAESRLGWAKIRIAPSRAAKHLRTAISVLESDGRRTWLSAALRMLLSSALHSQGDLITSEAVINEAIQIHNQLNDKRGLLHTLNNLAWVHFLQSQFEQCIEVENRVILLNQQFRDVLGLGLAFSTKALAEFELGQFVQAKGSVIQGLLVVDEAGVDTLKAPLWHVAGALAYIVEGDAIEACRYYSQSSSLAQRLGQIEYILLNLINQAQMAIGANQSSTSSAVEWLSAMEVNARRVEYHLPLAYQTRLDQLHDIARARLGAEAYTAAQMQGGTLTLDVAIALAQTATENMAGEIEAG